MLTVKSLKFDAAIKGKNLCGRVCQQPNASSTTMGSVFIGVHANACDMFNGHPCLNWTEVTLLGFFSVTTLKIRVYQECGSIWMHPTEVVFHPL